MQKLSKHLHSPEQLMSEGWEIEVKAAVRPDAYRGGWGVMWFDVLSASERGATEVVTTAAPQPRLPLRAAEPEPVEVDTSDVF